MINESKTKSRQVNYYLTLDIGPGASHNEILHAYNRAKNTYSEGSLASYTLMDEGDNSSIMEEIEEAFLVLGNPSKRREYDIQMGFNTWADDKDQNPENMSAADLLGKARPKKKSTPVTAAPVVQAPPISSVAASIVSIGDMAFEEGAAPSATVIPMKPVHVAASSSGKTGSASVTTSTSAHRQTTVGGVEFEANPEFEKQIASCEDASGEFLKAVRIYRRYSPESLALRCKLSAGHVLTIENEDASQMPQPVYLRGHVYLICHALDLPNPDRLAKKFVDRMVQLGRIKKSLF